MAKAHLRDAVDAHLRRIGSDIDSFLKAGLERGYSPAHLADELHRLTEIEVNPRTLYRWIDDLGIETTRAAAS